MEQLNLPRHVIEMFEKRWPERFSSRPSMARQPVAGAQQNELRNSGRATATTARGLPPIKRASRDPAAG
jgi:hypothetical protein